MKRITVGLAIAALAFAALAAPAAAHTLGWAEAKRAAKRVADDFPIYAEKVSVSWCNRWSKHEIHCGVRGTATEYDPDLEEVVDGDSCSVTAIVKKKAGSNRKHVRSRDDLSCFYY